MQLLHSVPYSSPLLLTTTKLVAATVFMLAIPVGNGTGGARNSFTQPFTQLLGDQRIINRRQAKGVGGWDDSLWELRPQVPGATMTGIRTFIEGQGNEQGQASQILQTQVNSEHHDEWPFTQTVIEDRAPAKRVRQEYV